MRIKWNGSLHKVDIIQIEDTKKHIMVRYWQKDIEHSFFLKAPVLPNQYIYLANKSLLEKGYFNFDKDYGEKGDCF